MMYQYKEQNPRTMGFRTYLVMIMFSVLYLYSVSALGINVSLFRIALLVTIIFTVVGLFLNRIKIYRTHLALYFFIFSAFVLSGVDALRSQQNSLILKTIAGHILAMVVLWVSVLQLNTEFKVVKAIKWYVFASAIAAGITIITFAIGHMPFPRFVTNVAGTSISLSTIHVKFLGVIPRATAAFFDPSFYGLFLCICLCFAVFYKSWVAKSSFVNLLIVLNVIMLIATLSRTAWIGALILAIIICIYISRKRLSFIATGLLLLAAVASIVLSIGLFGAQDFGKLTDVASLKSLETREMYWNAGVSEFFAHPLSGGGSQELGEAVGGTPSAHIVYLSWLAKYGIIGFVIYSAFLFYPIGYALFKRSLAVQYKFLILGVMVPMVVMYFGYDFFSNLDIEYLAFGIVYAIVLNRIGCKMDVPPAIPARSVSTYSLSP